MVPYANRIAHGRFEFGARTVQLERNWSEDPHPLHGQGWRKPWHVVSESASGATLGFDGGADEWPWRYRCEQHFHLQPTGCRLNCRSRIWQRPMPAMLGLHPYFPDATQARLQARLPRVWLTDRGRCRSRRCRRLPRGLSSRAGRQNRAAGSLFRRVGRRSLVTMARSTVTVTALACRYLHVYVPADKDYFCVEPQTAATGALSREPTRRPS